MYLFYYPLRSQNFYNTSIPISKYIIRNFLKKKNNINIIYIKMINCQKIIWNWFYNIIFFLYFIKNIYFFFLYFIKNFFFKRLNCKKNKNSKNWNIFIKILLIKRRNHCTINYCKIVWMYKYWILINFWTNSQKKFIWYISKKYRTKSLLKLRYHHKYIWIFNYIFYNYRFRKIWFRYKCLDYLSYWIYCW
jgi:hypothetical protein